MLVLALHLSDALGDFAGTHAKVDADWNAILINKQDTYNTVKFADYLLCLRWVRRLSIAQSLHHDVFIEKNSFYDDDWNSKQVAFLSKYFAEKPICVYFGEGAVGKTVTRSLEPSSLLAVYYDKWFM